MQVIALVMFVFGLHSIFFLFVDMYYLRGNTMAACVLHVGGPFRRVLAPPSDRAVAYHLWM